MIIADCHLHSEFSSDSDTPVTTMLEQAFDHQMKYFYLTDHHDIDFPPEAANGLTFLLDTDAYFRRLTELKEQYAGRIEIRYGVELGLMSHITDKLYDYTRKYPFDFIIGSSHLVRGIDPYYPEYYEGRSETEAYREYFQSIDDNVHAFHDYDVYGHLDYVVRYGPTKNTNWNFKDYADIFESLLKKIISDGKGIEINTAGLYKGLGYPHPHKDILMMYKELGGEIITIGSDAHTPENFAYGFGTAEALLSDCGFRYYCIYKNRKPEYLPLA
ncbi:MAG: histidinol-phosphatase HisJ family protein [Lachnospiraceae bacterium]|nr:histidinol-phosphatase HisJ family protein [Lachnospiraceae bacterium]